MPFAEHSMFDRQEDETDQQRGQVASKLVDRFSLWSGAAGLIAIPIVDRAAVGGVQLQMLRRLSEIYGVPFSENRGKSLFIRLPKPTAVVVAVLAGTTAPAMLAIIIGGCLKSFRLPASSLLVARRISGLSGFPKDRGLLITVRFEVRVLPGPPRSRVLPGSSWLHAKSAELAGLCGPLFDSVS
jgi:hypothetical protein